MFAESRIGRQPNAIKHAAFLELTRIKTEKGIGSLSDPFSLSETKLDLAEVGNNDSVVAMANELQTDVSVRASRDGERPPKKQRRRYRRRSEKLNSSGTSNDSCSNDPQPCLGPTEIKQEVTSSVEECDAHSEPLDECTAEPVQEFATYEQQRSMEMLPPECTKQSSAAIHRQNAESVVDSGFTEHLPSSIPPADTAGGGYTVLTAQSIYSANAAVSAVASSQTSAEPNYEDIVLSMQRAYYDLLPILHRV